MGYRNVPDDWGCYFTRCSLCGTRYHASEGGCGCTDDQERCRGCGEYADPDEMHEIVTEVAPVRVWRLGTLVRATGIVYACEGCYGCEECGSRDGLQWVADMGDLYCGRCRVYYDTLDTAEALERHPEIAEARVW